MLSLFQAIDGSEHESEMVHEWTWPPPLNEQLVRAVLSKLSYILSKDQSISHRLIMASDKKKISHLYLSYIQRVETGYSLIC